ncbi:MAG: ArnT family glycosyltransferase [Candidatus Puniceispirillaceae bacterium]
MIQAAPLPKMITIASQERPLLAALGALALIRLCAIILTPLEFGVDEAQYWLWGQALDFGYYSKPPLIGWYLGLMDSLFGASTIAARAATPFIHLGIALILFAIAWRYHSPSAGRWAALLWMSLPIVSLGSFVISTDTLLLLPWALALLVFFEAQTTQDDRLYFRAGLIIGIGLLAKYAAIYFIIGCALSLALPTNRPLTERLRAFCLLLAGALITSAPNLIWNLYHGGITFAHLGENADLAAPLYSFENAFEFFISQSAVIGPVAFIMFAACLMRRNRLANSAFIKMLLCFSLPVLIIMTIQAYLKTANANWAATAWPTACIVIGCALAQDGKTQLISSFWGKLALSVNVFAALLISFGVAAGHMGALTPASDPLRRLRGWQELATDTIAIAERYNITTIIADRRAEAALLSWHLHDSAFSVKVFDEDNRPGSHFELNHALSPMDKGPFLLLTGRDGARPSAFVDATGPVGESITQISDKRTRHKVFFIVK